MRSGLARFRRATRRASRTEPASATRRNDPNFEGHRAAALVEAVVLSPEASLALFLDSWITRKW